MNRTNASKGFSMLEMGVSMTIIAMLVAAVVAGNNLKTKLQLNEVVEDISKLSIAVKEFKETYGAYPGDMFDAEDKFGESNTDSGNGDETLRNPTTGTVDGISATVNEYTLFFDHLALSGLITDAAIFKTTPFKNGEYNIFKYDPDDRLRVQFSKAGTVGILTTKQAFDIDAKYDDGNPSTGNIIAIDGTGETAEDCVNTTATPNAYNLGNADEEPCVMRFYIE